MKTKPLFSIRRTKPTPWWIYPILKPGRITMLASEPGAGKSTLMLAALLDMFKGIPFLGNPITTHCRRTLVFGLDAPEDDYGFVLHRLANAIGIDNSEGSDLLQFTDERVPLGALIKKLDEVFPPTEVVDYEEDGTPHYYDQSNPVEILILDALRQVHVGDENDSRAMGEVMDALKRIAKRRVAILFAHHVGKAMKDYSAIYASRGSSVIAGSTDICINMTSTGHGHTKVTSLRVTKGRGHDLPDSITYKHSWTEEAVSLIPIETIGPVAQIDKLSNLAMGGYTWQQLLAATKLSGRDLKAACDAAGWARVGSLWQRVN